jgi:fermentation-respiration switch protein FrsA (DUF1100 family)
MPALFAGLIMLFTGCANGGRAWLQQKLIYFPSSDIAWTPSALSLDYKDVLFRADDGVNLHAWFIPRTNSHQVALICHGNGGNLSDRLQLCQLLHDTGLNVFIFDYRGFGKSEGKPDEQGTYSDAVAAWNWVHENNFKGPDIIAVGESLGGAIAAELATRKELGGLVLQSTFTSMPAIGAEVYSFLPVKWLCTFKYDTISKLPKINIPVLILHARDDTFVKFHHAEELYAAANNPKLLRELDGSHNDALSSNPVRYEKAVEEFLILLNKTEKSVSHLPHPERTLTTGPVL